MAPRGAKGEVAGTGARLRSAVAVDPLAEFEGVGSTSLFSWDKGQFIPQYAISIRIERAGQAQFAARDVKIFGARAARMEA